MTGRQEPKVILIDAMGHRWVPYRDAYRSPDKPGTVPLSRATVEVVYGPVTEER